MKNHTLTNEDGSSYARNRRKERMNAGKATGVWRRQSTGNAASKTGSANSRAATVVYARTEKSCGLLKITPQGIHRCQRRQGSGFGAQDARAQRYRGKAALHRQFNFHHTKAALRAGEQGHGGGLRKA